MSAPRINGLPTQLSVIICTHNPRPDYLRRTLAALKTQTLPLDQWEFLLVDNASQPPVAEGYDLTWHPRARHVQEPALGLTPARLRGITESCGQWMIFVDDDNVLVEDYLANALALATRHPHLAVLGAGKLLPEFEIPPPPELQHMLFMLALRDTDAPRWGNNPTDATSLPCGAGMCVQRKIAAQYVALIDELRINTVLDRKGKQLYSHGDDLFSWAAARAGQGFGVFPELRVTHLIGAGRLNRKYFLKLIYFSAFSHWILHFLLAGERPKSMGCLRPLRLIPHALRRGIFSARCQWGWLVGEHRAARFISEKKLSPAVPVAPKADC